MEPLGLEDYLLIAEAVLGESAERLSAVISIPAAESALAAPFASFGGVDFYPDLPTKAAVLCSRLIRNHPIRVDGNKRAALLSLLEFVARNGGRWHQPEGGDDEVAQVLEDLTVRAISEPEFTAWIRTRLVS